MPVKEKSIAPSSSKAAREYPDDAMTTRGKRALKSGRKVHVDVDDWLVDAKTGDQIPPSSSR